MYEIPEKDIVAIMKNLNREEVLAKVSTITERKKRCS